MKKIAQIKREDSNIHFGIFLGTLVTAVIGTLSWWVLELNPSVYLTPEKLPEIGWLVPSVLIVFIIHEVIHVALFHLFGKGKARIKIRREKSLGAVVMHQVNEDVYYKRWQMLTILLTPLVSLTILLLLLSFFFPFSYLIFFNIVLNALGSSVDIYVSYQLLIKHDSNILINFDKDDIHMNIYVR